MRCREKMEMALSRRLTAVDVKFWLDSFAWYTDDVY